MRFGGQTQESSSKDRTMRPLKKKYGKNSGKRSDTKSSERQSKQSSKNYRQNSREKNSSTRNESILWNRQTKLSSSIITRSPFYAQKSKNSKKLSVPCNKRLTKKNKNQLD